MHFVLLGATTLTTLGCGQQSESPQSDAIAQTPTEQPLTASKGVSIGTTFRGGPGLQRLLGSMDALGPLGEKAFELDLEEYAKRDDAVMEIRNLFDSLPVEAGSARWRVVRVAAGLKKREAVEFLRQQAVSAPVMKTSPDGELGDPTHRVRYSAAVGLVRHLLDGVDGADEATRQVFNLAEPEIAKLAALELFSKGQLSNEHKEILRKRGIAANFRRIEGSELDALRTVKATPAVQRANGKNRRRLLTTVPPEVSEAIESTNAGGSR